MGGRWYSGLLQWIADSRYKKGWKSLLYANLLLQKKHLIWCELCSKILKYLIAESSSGSNGWARVKRERTKSRERLLRTILFYSGHLQDESERPGMERKYLNSNKAQRIHPKLTIIYSVKCVVPQIYKAIKLAFCNIISSNQRLWLSLRLIQLLCTAKNFMPSKIQADTKNGHYLNLNNFWNN